MQVRVNEKKVNVLPGMTVRSALLQAGLLKAVLQGARVVDAWDQEVGLDGALEEGSRLRVISPPPRRRSDL
jgi:hypothetical protein